LVHWEKGIETETGVFETCYRFLCILLVGLVHFDRESEVYDCPVGDLRFHDVFRNVENKDDI
jgi:hypothetical protein